MVARFVEVKQLAQADLYSLLRHVRFPLMSGEFLRQQRGYSLEQRRQPTPTHVDGMPTEQRQCTASLDTLTYYQERRLSTLGLDPIETAEEIEQLRAVGDRAGGRRYGADDYGDW